MAHQLKMKVPQLRFKGFSEEWGEKTLGEICFIGDIDHRMPQSAANGIPYVMTGDFTGINEINFKNTKLISNNDYEQLSKKIKPEAGDILFARYASVGAVRYVRTQREFLVSYSCAILKNNASFDSECLFYYLQSNGAQRQVGLEINTGSQRNIGIDSLKSLTAISPKIEEQNKVASLLSTLDQMITLHQRKHEKLVTLKKAMLKKMFPAPGATIPEIRFKGFSEPWKEEALGEISTNVSNNTLSRAELNNESGLAKNIHYGDILIRFGEVLDVDKDKIPFISNSELVSKFKAARLQNGDIIIADTAEDESVGKCAELINVGAAFVLSGLHTIAVRPTRSFATAYLGYFMNSPAYHDQLLRLMQGTKVLSIAKTTIKQTTIFSPINESEQAKIGAYFRQLDELIVQHSTQIEKLRQLKVSCLEKMFV